MQKSDATVQFPFRGVIAPVFTPFDRDQNIDFTVVGKYASYLFSQGIEGILVNGTTGEGTSLTADERKEILEAWIREAAQYGLKVIAQVGGTNMKDVKALARHAEKCKVLAILCLADLFFRPASVDDLVHYLKIVSAEAPNTPLLYYHIPSFNGININMKELLERSFQVPNLVGIKFTDNDLVTGRSCVSNYLKRYVVFLGSDQLFLSALSLGFDSTIATTCNLFPSHFIQILRYFNEKKFDEAAKVQEDLNKRIDEIMANSRRMRDTSPSSWVSYMKAAMNKLTPINVGSVRDPLIEANLSTLSLISSE